MGREPGVAMRVHVPFLLCLFVTAARAGLPCLYNDVDENGNSASYDLRALVSPATYIFRAKIGSFHYRYLGQQYDYLINVCDDVHPDAMHSACNELAAAPAYQVTAPPAPPTKAASSGKYTPPPPPDFKPACFRLADSGEVKFEMLNTSNPDQGVKVLYHGGQRCRKRNTPEVIKKTNETWQDIERQVELHLECGREMASSLTDYINSGATVQVEEKPPPDECVYVVRWRTPHACPYGGGYERFSGTATGFSTGGGSGGDSWFWFLVKWVILAGIAFVVVVSVLCLPSAKKRFAQYQRGDFLSFGEFVGYLLGDIHVKMKSMLGASKGLPM